MKGIDVGRKEQDVHSIIGLRSAFMSGCCQYSERMPDLYDAQTIRGGSSVTHTSRDDHLKASIEKETTDSFDKDDGGIVIERHSFLTTKGNLISTRDIINKQKKNNAGSIAGPSMEVH